MSGARAPDASEAAVVDVGSNSVRLVIYRVDGRAMTPFLNEKVMAGLGRGLPATGRLSPEGVEAALRALKRFRTLIDALGVRETHLVATAAVREAEDGAAFAKRVKEECGLTLRIISGAQEARLSALGVMAGAPEADGVVGDLGGSSLELVELGPEGPFDGETFPLGPLALMRGAGEDFAAVEAVVDAALARSRALQGQGGAFYAVGGAWRAIGRIDMELRGHPLQVLHQYEMSRAQALKAADFVRKASRKTLEKLGDAAAKRADALPLAGLVLERVLLTGQFDRVVLSSYGLREGLLFERLSKVARAQDPLIAGAESFGAANPRARAFGAALARWLAPVLSALPSPAPERDRVLAEAACRLADIGGALHPEQRRESVYDLILRAPFVGLNHGERAFLAAVVHHRYTRAPPRGQPAYERLLGEDRRAAAAALGAGMRLGADLSGRSEKLLGMFTLARSEAGVALSSDPRYAHLITETVARRVEALSAALAAAAGERTLL